MKHKKQATFYDKQSIKIEENTSMMDQRDIVLVKVDELVLKSTVNLPENFETNIKHLKYEKIETGKSLKFHLDEYNLSLSKEDKELKLMIDPFFVVINKNEILERILGNELVTRINQATKLVYHLISTNLNFGDKLNFDNICIKLSIPREVVLQDSLDNLSIDYSKPIKLLNTTFNDTSKEFLNYINNLREALRYKLDKNKLEGLIP